ncbi:hypothetical protein CDO73_10530 [Saccharibacillus sp. O23]|nr:hypothetical protein CDO73_10530 [Saccharibacillus sp. O23]
MNLRGELLPRPVGAEELEEIERSVGEIEELLESGKEAEAAAAIEVFNARHARAYGEDDFRSRAGSMSRIEFALGAAQPRARRIADIAREELIEIVRRIQEPDRALDDQEWIVEGGQTNRLSDAAESGDRLAAVQSFYLELLEAQVDMPDVSDLIFWDDLEPEEIVDRALAYRPIVLPPG